MKSIVLLNFFKFLPLDAEHAEKCPFGDDPGILLVAAKEDRDLHWCFVGRSETSLRELAKSIVTEPGPLRSALASGARFATTVVRNRDDLRAAESFLVSELSPCHNPNPAPLSPDVDCKLKFYGAPGDRPAYPIH